jgi:hypothetical protein
MRILFSTGNEGKFEEAKHALSELIPGATVLRANVDPAEIQGSCDDIATEKTRSAIRLWKQDYEREYDVDFFVTEDVRCASCATSGYGTACLRTLTPSRPQLPPGLPQWVPGALCERRVRCGGCGRPVLALNLPPSAQTCWTQWAKQGCGTSSGGLRTTRRAPYARWALLT